MTALEAAFLRFTDDWRNPAGVPALAAVLFSAFLYREYARFVLRSVSRNLLRTVLTAAATAVLVFVVTMVWSILSFLARQTEAKSNNLKAVVREKYQMPGAMPYAYAARLAEGAPQKDGDHRIDPGRDSMPWSIYIGTLDPNKKTREGSLFCFAMEPRKIMSVDSTGRYSTMMDDLDGLTDEQKRKLAEQCEEMETHPYKALVGPGRLATLGKKVGERIKVTGMNYAGIDLELEILGELPGARYEQNTAINYRYLDEAVRKYNQGKSKDSQHPMTEKTLAMMWLRVPDTATFEQVSGQISGSPEFRSPAVKVETASSGVSSFLDSYKDLLWAMRWMLVPAMLSTMTLVVANALSISVRERRTELAVLKVLGFSPDAILLLVLGESLLVGCLSGLLAGCGTWLLINQVVGGVALPVGFLGKFFVDDAAPWWGLCIGGGTALIGSLLPAWSARSVRAAEVFSRAA